MVATHWGIASAGKISADFTTALRTLPASEHRVSAVAARDLARAQQFAAVHKIPEAYGSYRELAEDEKIEVVYVGNVHPEHFATAKLMLDHGKHVLCEKPLTMNSKQTKELIDLAKEKKLFLMEGIWSRCFPMYDTVKRSIDGNIIGDIHQVIVSFGFPIADVERLKMKSLGGGTILDLAVYGVQFACLVFNNEKPCVIKAAGCLNEEGVDQSASISLVYEGKRTASIVTHSLVELSNEAHVVGTKGTIRVPRFWCPTTVQLSDGTVYEAPLPEVEKKFHFINSAGLRYEASHIRDCIRQGKLESDKVPHELSLRVAEILDEIRRQVGVEFPEDRSPLVGATKADTRRSN